MTPEIVTLVPPAEIEPVVVPPSVPVPLVRASETPVEADVDAPVFPYASFVPRTTDASLSSA